MTCTLGVLIPNYPLRSSFPRKYLISSVKVELPLREPDNNLTFRLMPTHRLSQQLRSFYPIGSNIVSAINIYRLSSILTSLFEGNIRFSGVGTSCQIFDSSLDFFLPNNVCLYRILNIIIISCSPAGSGYLYFCRLIFVELKL